MKPRALVPVRVSASRHTEQLSLPKELGKSPSVINVQQNQHRAHRKSDLAED